MSSYNYKEGLKKGVRGDERRDNVGTGWGSNSPEGNSRGITLYPAPHKGGRGERCTNKTISKRIALKERSIKKKRVSVMDGSREAGRGEVQGRVSWRIRLFKHGHVSSSMFEHGEAWTSKVKHIRAWTRREPAWTSRTNFAAAPFLPPHQLWR